MFLSSGTITYCSSKHDCHTASSQNHYFANGIVRGKDNWYYIADSAKGKITVHNLSATNHTLTKIDEIQLGMPIDNLSVDSQGAIFAAAIPDSLTLVKAPDDPFGITPRRRFWGSGGGKGGPGKGGRVVIVVVEEIMRSERFWRMQRGRYCRLGRPLCMMCGLDRCGWEGF
jgi:hypothetical protein